MMQVADVMTRDVEVVPPDATIQEAAVKMKALDVGILPVHDGRRVVGVVTDRDLAVRGAAEGRDPSSAVREVMSPEVLFCFEDQDIEDAGALMEDRQVRRLVVLGRDQRLTGILSLGDLATGTGDETLPGEILRRVSEPGESAAP